MDFLSSEYLTSILTPFIGVATVLNLIVVTYVGIQQYLLRKEDLGYNIHKDLYDRRLKVFQETMEMLRTIVNEQEPQWHKLIEILRRIEDDAYFLFEDQIHNYINDLISKGNKKRHLNREIDRLSRENDPSKEERRLEAINEEAKLTDWFYNQFKICRNKFNKYLSYEAYLKQ